MLFLKFLKFFEGHDVLRFDADCGETALGLMNGCGIIYSCTGREEDGSVKAEISHGDRQKVISLLDKNGIRVYIIYERGFPALVSRYRRRPGILIGAVIFLFTMWLSTQFIWNIEVYSSGETDKDKVIDNLSSLGCRVGAYIPGIDFYSLCTKYLLIADDTAWVSVNMLGTTAEVRLLPRMDREGQSDVSGPANVISKYDGVVEYVNTFDGDSVVTDGDSVVKGQLLISGVIEDKNDFSNRFVRADGIVMAKTYHELTVSVPLEYTERVYSGQTEQTYDIGIFAVKLRLKSPSLDASRLYEEDYEEDRIVLPGNIILPVTKYVTSYHPYTDETRQRTSSEAALIADAEMAEKIASELADAEIISRETEASVVTDEDGYQFYNLCCRIRCVENIAHTVPLTVTD